jgi:Retrotransposon gag protein/Zinc knuckle
MEQFTAMDLANQLRNLKLEMQALQESYVRHTRRQNEWTPAERPKPGLFDGSPTTSVDAWLFQMEQYFKLCPMSAELQINTAAMHFRENAALWWRVELEANGPDNAIMFSSWEKFKSALLMQFKPINSIKAARRQLANLRQNKSVQDYTFRFRQLILEIPGMTDEERLDRFLSGLKPEILNLVELREPASFADAVRIAETVDQICHRPGDRLVHHGYRQPWINSSLSHSAVPMEIDTIESRRLTDKERESLKQKGSCFHCRQQGHMAQQCPLKGRGRGGATLKSRPQ